MRSLQRTQLISLWLLGSVFSDLFVVFCGDCINWTSRLVYFSSVGLLWASLHCHPRFSIVCVKVCSQHMNWTNLNWTATKSTQLHFTFVRHTRQIHFIGCSATGSVGSQSVLALWNTSIGIHVLRISSVQSINQPINQFIRQQRAEGHLQVAKYNIQ